TALLFRSLLHRHEGIHDKQVCKKEHDDKRNEANEPRNQNVTSPNKVEPFSAQWSAQEVAGCNQTRKDRSKCNAGHCSHEWTQQKRVIMFWFKGISFVDQGNYPPCESG